MKKRIFIFTVIIVMISNLISSFAIIFLSKISYQEGINATFMKVIIFSIILSIIVGGVLSYFYSVWITKPIDRKGKELENIRKEFVANVSHELKTPLTSISGYIETLQNGAIEKPEIRDKFLDIIAIETARLNRLIEDLLIISDIESGRESNPHEKVNIKIAIDETVELLQTIAEPKGVKFVSLYDGQKDIEEIFVDGSVDRFKQMMLNLIENAIKYSNNGGHIFIEVNSVKYSGVEVPLKLKSKSNSDVNINSEASIANDAVVIKITDEGIGIPKEHMDRLFERFYRVDKSRSQRVGGTGLGLSIVKHIISLFEGEISVESTEGKGTTFTVKLPMSK